MQASSIPPKFPVPFGNSASSPTFRRTIPQASQIGIQAGAASLTDGFPPVTFLPTNAGGTPPFGADFNGLLYQMTQWAQWQQAGGPVYFDASFAASIGGYPKQTVLSALNTVGGFWLCLADNNSNNPDTGHTTNWAFFNPLKTSTTGDIKWRPTIEVLLVFGWLRCNFLTVGDGLSNATEFADPTCFALFVWVWTNFTDAQCPMYTSGNVLTPRGATALIDWNNHSQISLPDMRGTGPFGVDNMGNAQAGRYTNATFATGNSTLSGSKGNFIQPTTGATNSATSFQTGTWYISL